MDEMNNIPAETVRVVDVTFRSGGKVYYFDPGELEIPAGSHVIIDTARGVEYGTCAAGNHTVRVSDVVLPLRRVLRIATEADERTAAENREKEKRAYDICLQKIAEQGLEMQLVSAEYAFDGSKILFFFTADGRVDFRELVKSLAAVFRTRIELRQIGVRDKAKMVGGLGVCGRPFCCSQFLEDFQPVSIKMAKVQNLSLNPTKISGTCGRLMCCLKYEQEAYEDLLRTSPKNESFVDTPDGRGTITEVNLLRQRVKVRMEDHPEEIHSFANDEIAILRSGKGHKNDPPIPKEIAPISGNREKRTRLRSSAPSQEPLEPVVIRSMPDKPRKKREEQPEPEKVEKVEKPERPEKEQSRRSRRNRKPDKAKVPQEQRPAKPQKEERPAKQQKEKRHEAEKRVHEAEKRTHEAAEKRVHEEKRDEAPKNPKPNNRRRRHYRKPPAEGQKQG